MKKYHMKMECLDLIFIYLIEKKYIKYIIINKKLIYCIFFFFFFFIQKVKFQILD